MRLLTRAAARPCLLAELGQADRLYRGRRRHQHDLNAVSGNQLRRTEVPTQIQRLDVRQDEPDGRGEHKRAKHKRKTKR
jgi:hypothetical protein